MVSYSFAVEVGWEKRSILECVHSALFIYSMSGVFLALSRCWRYNIEQKKPKCLPLGNYCIEVEGLGTVNSQL